MRILFVFPDFVAPAVRGGQLRALSQLRVLCSLDEVERVRLFSVREDAVSADDREALVRELPKLEVPEPVLHPIHLFSRPRYLPRVALLRIVRGLPYLAGKWDAPAVRRGLEAALLADDVDVVWLETLGVARYLPLVRQARPRARVVLDVQNVETELWSQYVRGQRLAKKLLAGAELRAVKRFERDVVRAVDAVGTISDADAQAMRALAGIEPVVIPQVVPFVRSSVRPERGRLCYVGSLAWHPNVRGLDWFCREVWPLVRAELPEATLDLAGSGLPNDAEGRPEMRPAWRVPGVRALGFVPDLAPVYGRSAALIAPILGGSGVRIKILEAFRHGVPVVTTPDGAAGLPLVPGRDAYVESDPPAFASRVVEIATSWERQARLREAGYAFLERFHGPSAAQAAVRELLGSATRTHPLAAGAA